MEGASVPLREAGGVEDGENKREARDEGSTEGTTTPPGKVLYNIEDETPLQLSVLNGLQLAGANISGAVVMTYLIRMQICMDNDNLAFAELLSSAIFMQGVGTFLQVTFGVRLPAIQGSASSYLFPIMVMMQNPKWMCPPPCGTDIDATNITTVSTTPSVYSMGNYTATEVPCSDDVEIWRPRLLQISGGLICASLVHVSLGLTGMVGFLLTFVGPLTSGTVVTLLGLNLFYVTIKPMETHWGIAAMTVVCYVVITLVLSKYHVPLPSLTCIGRKRTSKKPAVRVPIFKLFPVLLTVVFGWLICAIFTLSGWLPDSPDQAAYGARVDARTDTLWLSKWFFVPYPGYWGMPTVGIGVFAGMLAAVLQSTMESVGDYLAMADMCQVSRPPKHAVNRGIMVEGLASLFSGLLGVCHATTTYSSVLGFIVLTGICNRLSFQVAALIFMICGVFGKFGALLSMTPTPVMGAVAIVKFGLVTMVGLSSMRHCDLTSVRNMVIVGLGIMLGLAMPFYIRENPDIISTGSAELDQIIVVFLNTGMLIGGVLVLFLDNIIPGTLEERGMLNTGSKPLNEVQMPTSHPTYDLPRISGWLRAHNLCACVPFLPSYADGWYQNCCRKPWPRRGSHHEAEAGDMDHDIKWQEETKSQVAHLNGQMASVEAATTDL